MIPLNEYEARQADEIAAWKSERPSLVMTAFRGLGRPLSRLLARIVPDETLQTLAAKAEEFSTRYSAPDEIARKAGVGDLSELRSWTLRRVRFPCGNHQRVAERRAMAEGAVAGLGGIVTETLNLPILLAATLRSIFQTGHCYGYLLDTEIDRLFVLGVLELSTADDPARRQAVCQQLRDLGKSRSASPADGKAVPLSGLEESLLEDMAIGAVPLVGDLTWIFMDYDFIRRWISTPAGVPGALASRPRQGNGDLPGDDSLRRSSMQGAVDLAAQLLYAGSYGLAFGATLPIAVAARGIGSFENPIARAERRAQRMPPSTPIDSSQRFGPAGSRQEPLAAIGEPPGLALFTASSS